MFEVLVYVYENYWQGDACPELTQLGRKLTAVGFEADEIHSALVWLDGLNGAAQATQIYVGPNGAATSAQTTALPEALSAPESSHSLRVYSTLEQDHLGSEVLGFVRFLESSSVLPPCMREIVIDRAMAAPGGPLSLDDLKIIVLMVYWSFGKEPDALVLDELCDDADDRVAH
jgi:Smg protein